MRGSLPVRFLAPLLAVLLWSCGDEDDGPEPNDGLPLREWTFLTIAGATCADGSPTGVAVNPGPGEGVLIFLDGGGACLDYITCFEAQTSTDGPYGEEKFQTEVLPILPGTAMDPTAPNNPFRDYSYVFVPYCTGDVHVGDRVATYYDLRLDGHDYRHVGRENLEKALPRLTEIFPSPDRLVVSGASAGGFGAAIDYDLIRTAFPSAKGYLVDDSGPLLRGRDVPFEIKAAWTLSWRADEALTAACGSSECVDDWSQVYEAVRRTWPQDRIALLSSTQDEVIRAFLLMSGPEYEDAILGLHRDVIGPLDGAESFLVPGSTHTFLGAPQQAGPGGVTVEAWLAQMVSDDPAWTTVGP